MKDFKVAKVVLPIALDKEFDYSIPPDMKVYSGMRVLVNFAGRQKLGIVVSLHKQSLFGKLKPVLKLLDNCPVINEEQMNFAKTLSRMYPYAWAEFMFMFLPGYLKRTTRVSLESLPGNGVKQNQDTSNRQIFVKASRFLERYKMYRDRITENLKQGSVLICFPQLSYLEQVQEIIKKDFGDRVKVIHSRQKDKELFDNWSCSRRNCLILGTRSAFFFYPYDLKLLIIEEENSPYYFQEEKPFYNLLNVASIFFRLRKLDLILSADYPTLETYNLIKEGKVCLEEDNTVCSKIRVIDMARFYNRRRRILNPLLGELLRKAVEENKRSVIIWNRKGFGTYIACSSCGYIFKCGQCSGFLKLSAKDEKSVCSYCGLRYDLPKICSQCNTGYVKSMGVGIERLEEMLKQDFPNVKIANWDKKNHSSQIIIATSKILSSLYSSDGFDFGFLLDIDSYLFRMDYEATAQAYLYIKKLSLFFKEKFFVFTGNAGHHLFSNLDSNWQNFYEQEASFRKQLYLPPFGVIARIILREKQENKLLKKAQDLYNRLKEHNMEVYGPFQEAPFKLRDKFRYALVVKAKQGYLLRKVLKQEMNSLRKSHLKAAVIIR